MAPVETRCTERKKTINDIITNDEKCYPPSSVAAIWNKVGGSGNRRLSSIHVGPETTTAATAIADRKRIEFEMDVFIKCFSALWFVIVVLVLVLVVWLTAASSH